ncbi:hypothetical protein [Flavobacterium panacagri]|nr:hypothetical protein [Flavobacterium panacagri]
MDIELEKLEIEKWIMETDDPVMLRKVREILEKGLNKNSTEIKKDIK